MFGLIVKFKAMPGRREELIGILLESSKGMPGCLSYIIAEDPADAESMWITEVWIDPASHKASLGLPAVQQALAKAKPLLSAFGDRFETKPIGGHGLTT